MAGGKLPNARFRAAAVHAAPVFMDKAATTAKVLRLIEQAAKDSVSLLVFPEVFVPGFPVRWFTRSLVVSFFLFFSFLSFPPHGHLGLG